MVTSRFNPTVQWSCAAILAAGLVFAGAARAQAPAKFSGFLSDYSQLQARTDPVFVYNYGYVRPDTDWKAYDAVLVEAVQVVLKPGAQSPGFDPRDIAALTDYFEDALVRELGSAYKLIESPRPGALRLRIAITEIVAARPRESKGVDFLPMMLLARGLKGRSISVNVGSVALEAELLDDNTGGRLAAVVSSRAANTANPPDKGASNWQEVQAAMDFWAKRLRVFLDEARALEQKN